MSFEEGVRFDDVEAVARLDVPFRELMQQLVLFYTEQMLVKGYFHADPHPGNLFVELGFDPRSDPLRNWMLSPLYHVARIRIPLQIHQGANDSRVPRAQSDRLVRRMRELGQSVEYFVYPDEGHGFTRRVNEALAWERVVAFLRRWSTDPGSAN